MVVAADNLSVVNISEPMREVCRELRRIGNSGPSYVIRWRRVLAIPAKPALNYR